jgi:preprotein translocase subunit SecA
LTLEALATFSATPTGVTGTPAPGPSPGMSSSTNKPPKPAGTSRRRTRELTTAVTDIQTAAEIWKDATGAELTAAVTRIRQQLATGPSGSELQRMRILAFAVTAAAVHRTFGFDLHPTQILGGLVIADGNIAEMATGEGKTLTATLPAVWYALHGRGVHVATANPYLAEHGATTMAPVYRQLGLTVAAALPSISAQQRRDAYLADVTYCTAQQLGFDHLTDNTVASPADKLHRPVFHAAIIDEADAILIDEARTPLIMSGPADDNPTDWTAYTTAVAALTDTDYLLDEEQQSVHLTASGYTAVETTLGIDDLSRHPVHAHHVNAALYARTRLHRDQDYLVTGDGRVVLIDEGTGRPQPTRRLQDSLHEAVEAKEGVRVNAQQTTMASVTLQSFFGLYTHLGGMTGTAMTEADELATTYRTPVIGVPTHRPVIRDDRPDLLFATASDRLEAAVTTVRELHTSGQPVLIGTLTVEDAEQVSERLTSEGLPHRLITARNPEQEAPAIAQAGRLNAITVATNMAGRGVDIKLGGDPDELTTAELGDRDSHPDPHLWDGTRTGWAQECAIEREKVLAAGGLFVLAVGRNNSRRVDLQLRGRAGRQGEPGTSQFYLSCDDELVTSFGGNGVAGMVAQAAGAPGEPVTHRLLTGIVDKAQAKVEAMHADQRRQLLDYDKVSTAQRTATYLWRDRIMDSPFPALLHQWLTHAYTAAAARNPGDLPAVAAGCWPEGVPATVTEAATDPDRFVAVMVTEAEADVRRRLAGIPDPALPGVLHQILLQFVDLLWSQHLTYLDDLRDAVSLRSYSQQDPRSVYAETARDQFAHMIDEVHIRAARMLLRIQATVTAEPETH